MERIPEAYRSRPHLQWPRALPICRDATVSVYLAYYKTTRCMSLIRMRQLCVASKRM